MSCRGVKCSSASLYSAIAAPRLHRIRHQPVVGDVERNHVGRRLERRLGGGLVAERPVVYHVARRLRCSWRRAGLDCRANIGRCRQFFVGDDDGFRGIARLVSGLGDHHRDRLSDKSHGYRAPSAGHAPIFIGVPSWM